MLKWTSQPPTEPGWYWWRKAAGKEPVVAECFEAAGIRRGYFTNGSRMELNERTTWGEWWPAPIVPPQEEE